MKSSQQAQSALKAAVLLLFVVAVVLRWSQGELLYFVHPRSVLLIAGAAALSLALLVYSLTRRFQDFRHVSLKETLLLLACALCLLFVPARPLSSRISQLRAGVSLTTTRDQGSLPTQTTRFTVLDWVIALANDQGTMRYAGKPVDVVGLHETADEAQWLTRMVVSCCVLDAQPVRIRVISSEMPDEPGLWLHVTGSLRYNEAQEPYIEPTKIDVLASPPKEPYLY